jgi:hypothetical protein
VLAEVKLLLKVDDANVLESGEQHRDGGGAPSAITAASMSPRSAVTVQAVSRSLWMSSSFCTRAEVKPVDVRLCRAETASSARAIVPKSSGVTSRARMTVPVNLAKRVAARRPKTQTPLCTARRERVSAGLHRRRAHSVALSVRYKSILLEQSIRRPSVQDVHKASLAYAASR